MAIRKAATAQAQEMGPRAVRVVCSSNQVDRMGEIVVQDGIDLTAYRANPVVLWSHDPTQPIGRATNIGMQNGVLQADIEFAPEGISTKADEICGLVKSGVVNTISIGFQPVETEPMDPSRPRGPQKYLRSALLEMSLVSVPANTDANVIARAAADWKCGAARDLPVSTSDSWDGAAAEASIFDYAGGDDFDPAKAKRGFLAYDSANPKLRGSYKLPFARVIDGTLTAVKAGLDAAASRLPQADIPDEVRSDAQGVVDAYQKTAGEGEKHVAVAVNRRAVAKVLGGVRRKDLYEVGWLAQVLQELGCIIDWTAWEATLEQDGSKVPQMLSDALAALADAFLAMTQEEVAELLADAQQDASGQDAAEVVLMAATSPVQKAAGIARFVTRAGRVLSSANETDLRTAHEKIGGVLAQVAEPASDDPAEKAASLRRREVEVLELTAP